MSKTLILILSVFAITSLASHSHTLTELQPLWSLWKQTHSKAYSHTGEESARLAIFAENYKKISEFNSQSSNVKLALNRFGDLTATEFKTLHTGSYLREEGRVVTQQKQPQNLRGSFANIDELEYELLGLPQSVDWRQKGAITAVKNQGNCGSCWSFSTTGALEALYFITHGKLVSFSEQQLVDCDSQNSGCNGGLPEDAFQYTARKGLETEQDYPYITADGTCKYDASKAIKVNSGHKAVTPQSASALKVALAVQPVSIGIEADEHVFQFYSSGVISISCGDNLDHAVLAVGYTTIGSEEAFIVKNSWGPDWGSQGYVYISTSESANNGNGVCGILGDPVVPTA